MDGLNQVIITDIENLFTVSSPKGRYEKINNRKCYGLSFCKQGQITYSHNGRQYISDPEHAIILPKGQSYTLYGDKTGEFPVINFDCLGYLCNTMLLLPIRNLDTYIKDYEQMKSLSLFEKNRAKVISIFYDIIHRLSADDVEENGILAPAVKYLENNYSCPNLTNAMLAKQCSISEVYFRKLFTQTYGITPKQFIIDARINKAKQMLKDGVLKINAVAENCGFSNTYHFCRLFKQKVGLAPTEYMKQNRIYKI